MTSVRLALAAALVAAVAAPAVAGYVFLVEPSAAPVTVTSTGGYVWRKNGAEVGAENECVSFRNGGAATATNVRFAFAYLDGSGHVLGTDTFDREGTFAPGVTVEGGPGAAGLDLRRQKNCRPFTAPWGTAAVRVAVARVAFADGTTWERGGVPSTALEPVSTATNSPVMYERR